MTTEMICGMVWIVLGVIVLVLRARSQGYLTVLDVLSIATFAPFIAAAEFFMRLAELIVDLSTVKIWRKK